MKHGEHIVAFDKARFGLGWDGLSEGFNRMSQADFLRRAENSICISRRAELEKDEAYGQLLPYIVLYKRVQGALKVFAYQRGKGIGESRLAGNYSIGIGGHVDLADVVHNNSVILVSNTVSKSINREVDEEIEWEVDHINSLDAFSIKMLYGIEPVFHGIINDTSDPVGRVHYGALYSMEIPWNATPVCRERELVTVGLVGPDELESLQLENWSRIVLDLVDELEDWSANRD